MTILPFGHAHWSVTGCFPLNFAWKVAEKYSYTPMYSDFLENSRFRNYRDMFKGELIFCVVGNSVNNRTNLKFYKLLYLEWYYISVVWMGMNHEETIRVINSVLNFTSLTVPSTESATIHKIPHVGLDVNKSHFY